MNPLKDCAVLPRAPITWELGVVHAPIQVGETTLFGAVFVIETGSARIRALLPIFERTPLTLIEALKAAMEAPPAPFTAERPMKILVEDPALETELRLPLHGAGVPLQVVAALPSKDAATEALRQAMIQRLRDRG